MDMKFTKTDGIRLLRILYVKIVIFNSKILSMFSIPSRLWKILSILCAKKMFRTLLF